MRSWSVYSCERLLAVIANQRELHGAEYDSKDGFVSD